MTALAEREHDIRRAADRLSRKRVRPAQSDGQTPLWDAAFFKLDRVSRFVDAHPVTCKEVLDDCARAQIAESWRIERCGIEYCARMTLRAESDDERRMFALIGADEALHESWLAPWIAKLSPKPDPFNVFIAGLAEAGGPQPLAYLLQVVLEGFGITHYDSLACHCHDAGLATTLRTMAEDEALHHAGGLAAFCAERFTDVDRRFCAEAAYTFLQMIRCGPQGVVAAIDRHLGIRDQGDAARVFTALDAEGDSATKLNRLRRLMSQPGMGWLMDELDRGGLFDPCSAIDCAQIYAGVR